MSLLGRDHELGRFRDLCASSGLVTVWGPSGVGKTRLVHEALGGEADVCTLEGARDLDEVLRAIAQVLGARAGASIPLEPVVARARLRRGARPLVLDGADRALAAVRELVPRLAAGGGGPIVVTACRELDLPGERALELEPLASEAALALWMSATRARGHRSDPRTAARIVERLDRLPLAIEWFAARASVIGDAAGLERLERQPTTAPLSSALEASLEALSPVEREALFRLAAFEHGATARTIERELEIDLSTIESLVRASLVRTTYVADRAPRISPYRAVATMMRATAQQLGRLTGDLERHADAVLGLATRLLVGDAGDREAELRDERSELEAVLQRCAEPDPRRALRAAVALVPLYAVDRGAGRAADTLAELLTRVSEPPSLLARAHIGVGILGRRAGHADQAREHLEAALRVEGEHRFEARIELASLDRMQSRLDAALGGYHSVLADARALDNPELEEVALGELGRALQSLGRSSEARGFHAQAIAIARRLGRRHREALERSLHARATHRAGEVREAIPLHEQALALHVELGDMRLAAAERGHLGFCLHECGELARSEREFRASAEGLADVGDVALEAIERVLLARLLADCDRHAEARLELAIASQLIAPLEMPRIELTHGFVSGLVALGEGQPAAACELWQAALAHGVFLEVGFEALLPAYLALVESALGRGDPAAHLRASEAALANVGDAGLHAALATLGAAVAGTAAPDVPATLLSRSREARQAVRLAAMLRPRGGALEVSRDGRTAILPDGTQLDLFRRKAPRLLLVALAEARTSAPGQALGREALIEAGWPGERMRPAAAEKRLRTAVWTLRSIGLEPLLLTRDEGYLLDPFVALRWMEPPTDV